MTLTPDCKLPTVAEIDKTTSKLESKRRKKVHQHLSTASCYAVASTYRMTPTSTCHTIFVHELTRAYLYSTLHNADAKLWRGNHGGSRGCTPLYESLTYIWPLSCQITVVSVK